jgi:RND family efflux transporter MFP subunit
MKFKTVMSVALSLLLMTAVMFGSAAPAPQGEEGKDVKCPGKVGVLVEVVGTHNFSEFKTLENKILPASSSDFNSTVTGTVKSVGVSVGKEVKAGEIVLELDGGKLETELKDAEAKVKVWKKKLQQRRNWKVRSERAERNAEEIIKKNSEIVARNKEQLKNLTLTSPVNGIITEINVAAGDKLEPGTKLATVITLDQVKIKLTDYADKLSAGQSVSFKVKELSKEFTGTVAKDSDGDTFIVADNPGKNINSGMTANFRVLVEEHKDVVVLPEAKILKEGSDSVVYVANGKVAKRVVLKMGPAEKGMVLIKEGLSAGDELIVSAILSAKGGTLRDSLSCLEDNKKITVMVKHDAKDRYVKRKKGASKKPVSMTAEKKEMKKEQKEEKKRVVVKKASGTEAHGKTEGSSDLPPQDVFANYLTNNRESLQYNSFRRSAKGGMEVIYISCDEAAKDRILAIMDKFKAKEVAVTKSGDDFQVEASFTAAEHSEMAKSKSSKMRRPRRERAASNSRFRIGANLSYQKMSDSNFEDVYGRFVTVGADLSYMITDKLDVWLSAQTGSKSTAIPDFPEITLKFTLTPVALDLRYYFKRSSTWEFFGGAGLSYYTFKEENPIEEVSDNAVGFNILGGAYYNFTNNLAVQLLFRYNIVKKTIEEPQVDNELDLTSAELLFGISFRF